MKKSIVLFFEQKSLLAKRIVWLLFLICVAFHSNAQNQKINLTTNQTTLSKVFEEIEKQTGMSIAYNEAIINVNKTVSVNIDGMSLTEALSEILKGTGTTFNIQGRQIIISAAQPERQITGVVTNQQGETIVGATISIKGTTIATATDVDGRYTINASSDATLTASFVGTLPQDILVGNRTSIDFELKEDSEVLDEVVVVGFGTQKKVNLTGSVAVVKGDDMNKRPVANAASMLQSQIPGLRVTQSSGEPGNSGVSFRVRGQGTYSGAGSDPLVLINGVPGSISNIDPNSIESVSVLKDAASAAVYGARAANGVILVTTKTGKNQPTTISYRGNIQINRPSRMIKIVTNSAQYMELFNMAKENSGSANPGNIYPDDIIDLYRNAPAGSVEYPSYDWLGNYIKSSVSHSHNATIMGSTDKVSYNVMLNYADENGTMKGFEAQKYNVTFDLTTKINDWITAGSYVNLKRGDRQQLRQGSNDSFLSLMSQAPTYMPQRPDGTWASKAYRWESNNKNVPALIGNEVFQKITDYDVNAQVWLTVDILKGLSWHTKGAARAANSKTKDWRPTVPLYMYHTGEAGGTLDTGGSGLSVSDGQTFYTYLYSYLKYDFSLAKAHNFSLQFGYSQESNKYESLSAYRRDYNFPLYEINAGSTSLQENSGNSEEWALQGIFGRLNYDYKGKYLFEANFRYDGSSRISPESRWGWFPSFSGGWRFTEENFIKNLSWSWLNNGKIRASWGQLGNQNIGLYPYQALISATGNYTFDNANLTNGYAQTAYVNRNLKWETTTVTNVALELRLFRGLDITAEWYQKHTTDILRSSQVTGVLGLSAPTINDGEMKNRGIEVSVQYNNYIKAGTFEGLTYSAGFYLDHYKNELTKFGAEEISGQSLRKEGLPYNTFYMLESIGVFADQNEINNSPKQFNDNTLPGDLKYRDADGNDVIDNNDRVPIDGRFPSLEYGINGSVGWKGFDISVLFSGVQGIKYYVTDWGIVPFRQGSAPTIDYVEHMWTPENPNGAKYPRLYFENMGGSKNTRTNSYFLKNASYLKLRNLTVGYTFPKSLVEKAKIKDLRVYFSADNLFTITNYPELDPERGGDGRFVNYPQNKVFAFGLNITF